MKNKEENTMKPTNNDLMEVQNLENNSVLVEDDDLNVDSITFYMNEIGRIQLLTPEEEKKLSHLIKEGGIGAKEARNKLVEANLRLVAYYARKYLGYGMDFSEVNSMGALGLIKAAEKFDYSLGYRFSTYASWWIIQAIERGIADEGTEIRIPIHVRDSISKINRAKREFLQKNGFEASIEDISEIAELSIDKIESVNKAMYSMISLNALIGEDGDSTLEDFIPDTNAEDPCNVLMSECLRSEIDSILKTLSHREEMVIRLRNAIGCDDRMTLEEIATLPEFGITRERVRQIELKAMKKLRNNPVLKKLYRDYVA